MRIAFSVFLLTSFMQFVNAVPSDFHDDRKLSPRDASIGTPTINRFLSPREETTKIPIPSILPDWHGIQTPNYTTLYTQFTGPLHCGRYGLPIGVYGFYSWVCSLVILSSTIYSTIKDKTDRFFLVISHILGLIYFWTLFGIRMGGSAVCSRKTSYALPDQTEADTTSTEESGPKTIAEKFVIAWIFITVIASAPSFYCMISVEAAAPVFFLAALCLVLVPSMFYHSYTNFLYLDSDISAEILAVSIPIATFFALTLSLLLWRLLDKKRGKGKYAPVPLDPNPTKNSVMQRILNERAARNPPKRERRKMGKTEIIVWCVLASLFFFHVWAVAVGFVLLGRMVGDPWGKKVVDDAFGRANVGVTGVFVVLCGGVAFMAGASGNGGQ